MISDNSEATKRPKYLPAAGIYERYSMPVGMLAQFRLKRKGPPFVRAGYRTILYPVAEFEAWLKQQPLGGEWPRDQQPQGGERIRRKRRAA